MTTSGFALFPTALGACGIAWGGQAIAGVQLPEASEALSRARMQKRFPGLAERAPPPQVQTIIMRTTALLGGAKDDLCDVPLDMTGVPPFHQRVYELARRIPPGRMLTYGEVAAQLGTPGAARAARRGPGPGPQPVRAYRALPPRARGRGQDRGLLGQRRGEDQDADAGD